MIRIPSLLRRLRRHQRGTAILEFALIAPVFILLLMGLFDYTWQMYAKQVLQGAVSNAARASTLESAASNQTVIDAAVRAQVQNVFPGAPVTFTRKSYESFNDVGKPEPFTDANNNNRYDSGECFEDRNGNNNWDADQGANGNGGAEDVVLYTAKMKFERILPVWRMLGQPPETYLYATTVLRNQPYNVNTVTSKVICN
jgi:Flp pilus assembly protein TadG